VLVLKAQSTSVPNWAKIEMLAIAVALPVIFVIAFLFAPIAYTIADRQLIINRPRPNISIAIDEIEDIQRIHKKQIGIGLRVFGVGGFCGAYGLFYSFRIGCFKAYITNSESLVLIKHKTGCKLLISPGTPDDFVKAVIDIQME